MLKDPFTGETFHDRTSYINHILSNIVSYDTKRVKYSSYIMAELSDFFTNQYDAHAPFCYSTDVDDLLNVELISDILFYVFGCTPRFKFGTTNDYPCTYDTMKKFNDQRYVVRLADYLPALLYLSVPLNEATSKILFPLYIRSFPEEQKLNINSIHKSVINNGNNVSNSYIGYMSHSFYTNEDVISGVNLKITKEATFAASHQLPYHKGLCGHVHGHEWKFQIEVQLPHINKEGLLIDFSDLKARMKDLVVRRMDHCFINDILYNPTAENIAIWIYKRLGMEILGLVRVTVWETPTSSATFDLREVVR